MSKRYWIIILLLPIALSCQKSAPIEIQSILGAFHSIPDSEDYSYLELREDHTYYFGQAANYSCEIWRHYYGNWEINGHKLVLFEGVNLDSIIEVKANENFKADTLKILFSDAFLEELPYLKVRIGLSPEDMVIENQQIIFDKYAYCEKQNLFRSSKDKKSIYKHYPVVLQVRAGKYYYIAEYILDKDTIAFDLAEFEKADMENRKLLEYQLKGGTLVSTYCSNWINKHRLGRKK